MTERGPVPAPRPENAGELQRVLAAEADGNQFVLVRPPQGDLLLVPLGGDRVSIGRRPSNDIAIPWDPQVSRVHATLEPVASDWTIADDGLSRNGTIVNAERISGRLRLCDGDQIRLGGTALVFRDPATGASDLTAAGSHAAPLAESLSDSQRRVLVALCRPYRGGDRFAAPATNQEIADEVFLSVDAVKTHLRLLFQRFELQDLPRSRKRAQLASLVLQWGLVSERDL